MGTFGGDDAILGIEKARARNEKRLAAFAKMMLQEIKDIEDNVDRFIEEGE